MDINVDEYLEKTDQWQEELTALRKIILSCGLTEQIKWRNPCYSLNNKNIVLLGRLKKHCTLTFFKGAFLKDSGKILEKIGSNTKIPRKISFRNIHQIIKRQALIKKYILEAIALEKSDAKLIIEANEPLEYPKELLTKFSTNQKFESAFEKLTPGRRRGYILHFTGAKQAKTRTARIEKYTERIMSGKGINDCTCGLSKKMPNCDGSHNYK
ncbi:DUF1801 domain-containing protein [Flavicella sediminum]|uniref:DUF1801 domain-containing protein n=1 Tax=Flavicella sediminum TaxID=2585141 RepID=UPI0011208014|nr:DUF1801 domain-containing protein [Flavicella sediminum]